MACSVLVLQGRVLLLDVCRNVRFGAWALVLLQVAVGRHQQILLFGAMLAFIVFCGCLEAGKCRRQILGTVLDLPCDPSTRCQLG